jgi:hypothetical protein
MYSSERAKLLEFLLSRQQGFFSSPFQALPSYAQGLQQLLLLLPSTRSSRVRLRDRLRLNDLIDLHALHELLLVEMEEG